MRNISYRSFLLFFTVSLAARGCAGNERSTGNGPLSNAGPARITSIDYPKHFDVESSYCLPQSVNNHGAIVISCSRPAGSSGAPTIERHFVWKEMEGFRELPIAEPKYVEAKISDSGNVHAAVDLLYTVIDTENKAVTPIGSQFDLHDIGAVSTREQLLVVESVESHKNIVVENGVANELLVDGKTQPRYHASYINSKGVIFGVVTEHENDAWTVNQGSRLFVQYPDGRLIEISTPSKHVWLIEQLSENNNLIGFDSSEGAIRPLYYSVTDAKPIEVSAWVPEGSVSLSAENSSGLILGAKDTSTAELTISYESFVTRPGMSPRFLLELLPPDSGWTNLEGFDLSDSGYIVGHGVLDGKRKLFLMKLDMSSWKPH